MLFGISDRKLAGGGRATLQAVKHEIAILKKVNHRNVVKLLEVRNASTWVVILVVTVLGFQVIDGEDEDEMYLGRTLTCL